MVHTDDSVKARPIYKMKRYIQPSQSRKVVPEHFFAKIFRDNNPAKGLEDNESPFHSQISTMILGCSDIGSGWNGLFFMNRVLRGYISPGNWRGP